MFYLNVSQVHIFFRILVKPACFVMTIVQNEYQSLHNLGVSESKDCWQPNEKPKDENLLLEGKTRLNGKTYRQ